MPTATQRQFSAARGLVWISWTLALFIMAVQVANAGVQMLSPRYAFLTLPEKLIFGNGPFLSAASIVTLALGMWIVRVRPGGRRSR